jgi:predicted O-methyltransferase YrrM
VAIPAAEPTTTRAMLKWIDERTRRLDRFHYVKEASNRHRRKHGCDVYPSNDGPTLGVLAAASRARRVLEVGCGLGYSALWLAYGGRKNALVETIEHESQHAELARGHFRAEGLADRVKVHEGRAISVLPSLQGPYDLIYFDGDPAESLADLKHFERLLQPGGLLISANLFLGVYDTHIPGLDKTARFRVRILNRGKWLTAYLPDGLALSIRR